MKSRMYPLAFILLCGTLFAAEPIPINFFGDTEGRVLGQISPPQAKGDLVFTLDTNRSDAESAMYIATEAPNAVVQIIAVRASDYHSREFMLRLTAERETLLDLRELKEYDTFMMLSRENFYATFVGGDSLRSLAATELVFPGKNETIEPDQDPLQLKSTYCATVSTFNRLDCSTPNTCGQLSFFNFGVVQTDCPFPGTKALSWGCHSGTFTQNPSTTVTTISNCGCYGFATWSIGFGYDVWLVRSYCPGDPISTYFVN